MLKKGLLENEVCKTIIKFEKEYMGRGPEEVKCAIIGDAIFCRLERFLTQAERKLAEDAEGVRLVKQTRMQLLERARPWLEEMIYQLTGAKVLCLHMDLSTKIGEKIIVFTLDRNIEEANEKDG